VEAKVTVRIGTFKPLARHLGFTVEDA